MSTSTKLAGYGNIQIVSPYEIHCLSTLRVEKKVNEHARMWLTAIIPEEKKDSCVDMANDTDTIEIRELSDEGDVIRTLFHGVLSDIAVKVVRGVYHLEMEAVSHSYRLDLKPKTRSFQNHKMRYEELVQHILSDYPGSDFIDLTFDNAPLDQFTVQYEETDWQFLKRMVSRFGTALIPEAAADSPKLWVGLPEGKPDSLRNTNYQVLRSHNNFGQKEEGVTSYLIVTKRYYNLGDRILFKNKPLIVIGSTSLLHEGMLTHEYILQAEADSRWRPIWNESIQGASLAGKVIDAAKDKVKLHLNIDDVQRKEDACWFSYSSPYMAEGKTGLYCMPQIGDSVQLYIPNPREEEAFVRSSLREGGNSPKLGNPGVKYWGNPLGKEIKFSGNELRMTAQENHVFVKLHDNEGIELHSKDAIVLHADREIALEAGRLDIRGKEAVYLLSGSSSIVLDGDTDIKGARLRIEGLTKAPVQVNTEPVRSDSQSADRALKGSTSNNLSGQKLDVAQLALNMAGMVPVVGPVVTTVTKGSEKTAGKYESAALSVAGSVPFAGWTGVGVKAAQTVLQAAKGATGNTEGSLGQNSSFILGKVNTSARKLQSNHSREEVIERLKKQMQHKIVRHDFAGIPIYVRSRADAKPTTMDKILDIGDGLTIGGDQAISSFQNLLVEMGSDPIGVTSQMINDKVTGILKFANNPVESVLAVASNIKSTATHISQLYKDGNTKELASIVGNEVASSILSKGFSKGLNVKNGKSSSFKEGKYADSKGERTKGAGKIEGMPPIVQSRINLRNGTAEEGAGFNHVLDRHFNPSKNASQFSITPDELKGVLQSKEVVSTPVSRVLYSDIKLADGTIEKQARYVREVTLDSNIGIDKFSGSPTNIMTVLTDKYGNLVTATPGVIK
ncbi:hypothetical protein J27TS7_32090 [Paenibacillus dendritiformis]|uniref:contractile injection system protein, VgrG/Pvc8 family n=1 Tax=Paenibacillus dendritiformis TaxID=130049 RepID=UPI001B29FDEC|nr:contractile injection system protein, VgrG/Pvc8 family [Paenibacillus dendritiformis]GIO73695.1 hypothetical protein J27TS7_32090 [Paenibacillus dendritiformis]